MDVLRTYGFVLMLYLEIPYGDIIKESVLYAIYIKTYPSTNE